MKKYLKKLTAISCLILALALSSCATTKTEYKTIYILPDLYFPIVPSPTIAIPLDKNKEEVTDEETPIELVIVDYSFFNTYTKYKAKIKETETKYTTFKEKIQNN